MIPKKTIHHINDLQEKKYRKQYSEFIIEGVKGVTEALDNNADVLLVLLQDNKRDDETFAHIVDVCTKQNIPLELVGRKEIPQIKTTETFPGILAVVGFPEVGTEDVLNGETVICLDSIKDPGNLGTIIRTADWFGIKHIILSEDSVDPYNPKVVRSTMGSIFRVHIFQADRVEITLTEAKKDYRIVGLTMNGEPLTKNTSKKPTIYVFGSESHGVRPELEKLFDTSYTIEGRGKAESLNVAVAAGIVMNSL